MNKGLAIRNAKLKKNAKKRQSIKPGQDNLCRFITINCQIIEKINGKYKRTGSNTVNGLQIKNRVYLVDGKNKLINSNGVRIKKIYDSVPEWATESLIEKFEQFHNK